MADTTLQQDLNTVGKMVDNLNDFMTRLADQALKEEDSDRKLVLEAAALYMLFKGYEAAIDEEMPPVYIERFNELITSFVVIDIENLRDEEPQPGTMLQ